MTAESTPTRPPVDPPPARANARSRRPVGEGVLARLLRFSVLTLRKSGRDGITLQSSALAFNTVFAVVPLLAAFLFVGGHVFEAYRPQILAILRQILPYTEDRLLQQIGDFLTQAERLRGIGLAGFVTVALISFASVESTLNRIWNVTSARAWRTRLYSFFMLLLWGPLLIGAAYSVLAVLRRQTAFDRLWQESPVIAAIPFVITAFGLTMLYWLVPNTAVRLRCALIGGVSAALLIEGLRFGFKLYLRVAPGINLVYGGFALALIFMVSIDAAWMIVLLGSEISYTAQHFETMSRRRRAMAPLEGGWLALAVLTLIHEQQAAGRPSVAVEDLASRLELPSASLREALVPLLGAGWLRDLARDGEGLHLARPLADVPTAAIFELYDARQEELFAPLPPAAAARMSALLRRWIEARRAVLQGESVGPAEAPMATPSPTEPGPTALDSRVPVP